MGAWPCVVQCCLFLGPGCSGVNRVQVVCLDLVEYCFVHEKQLYVGIVVCISWLH